MKPLFKTRPDFVEVDPYKIRYNVGCMMDIPTGRYTKGKKGENILNGGISTLTGIVGKGNTFKSTIMHYMMLSASSTLAASGIQPYLNTYDTEMNIELDRLNQFAQSFEPYVGHDLHHEKIWSVTDSTSHPGDAWFKTMKEFLKDEKLKNIKSYSLETPFVDKDGKSIHTIAPTFGEIDSLTEFETSENIKMQDKNDIGASGGNTIHMRSGLDKTRLLMELPGLCNMTGHYCLVTAHVGKNFNMAQGPVQIPVKDLQHMSGDEKIKGVTTKFFFLPTAVWQSTNSSILRNQNTRGPEYPLRPDRPDPDSPDLNLVRLKLLRNKSGPSGDVIPIVVSQSQGVLASLSEFYFLKMNSAEKKYGIGGNDTTFFMDLYPNVNLRRTTLRNMIDTDPKLRRAIKITADMLQMKIYYRDLDIDIPDPKDLYEKLEKEYGWENLYNTRDFWTFDQYTNEVPFLSTMDLIEMHNGTYIPYWWCPETKTVKSSNQKDKKENKA